MSEHIVTLVAGRPDTEVATDLKNKLRGQLQAVCDTLTEAERAGLEMGFSVGPHGQSGSPRTWIIERMTCFKNL